MNPLTCTIMCWTVDMRQFPSRLDQRCRVSDSMKGQVYRQVGFRFVEGDDASYFDQWSKVTGQSMGLDIFTLDEIRSTQGCSGYRQFEGRYYEKGWEFSEDSLRGALTDMAMKQAELIRGKVEYILELLLPSNQLEREATEPPADDLPGVIEDIDSDDEEEIIEGTRQVRHGARDLVVKGIRKPPDKSRIFSAQKKRQLRQLLRKMRQQRSQSMEVVIAVLWDIHVRKAKRNARRSGADTKKEMMIAAAEVNTEEVGKLEKAKQDIQRFKDVHCQHELPGMRPEKFPEELWCCVMDI